MAAQEIVQLGHPSLRTMCTSIDVEQITQPHTQQLIKDLIDTLMTQHDGVGLSAPQIADTNRVFVISPRAWDDNPNDVDNFIVVINPEIVKTSRKTQWLEEGCLSIRSQYGDVLRHKKIQTQYYDQHGNLTTRGFSGFMSQVFQHELDHLNGVLFIDKAKNIHTELVSTPKPSDHNHDKF